MPPSRTTRALLSALTLPLLVAGLASCRDDPDRADPVRPVSAPAGRTLPRLFPEASSRPVGLDRPFVVRRTGHRPETVELRGHASPDGVEPGDVHLVVRAGDRLLRAPVPAGWPPVVRRASLAVRGGYALVVSQEGGDSDTWTVYVRRGHSLVQARRQGAQPVGGGFTPDGAHAYLSWSTPPGRLFTRVGLRGHRYHVLSWAVRGDRLVPHGLGTVCIRTDTDPVRYRPC